MYDMADSPGLGFIHARSANLTWLVVVANLSMKRDTMWSHERTLPGSREQYQSKAGPDKLLENCRQRNAGFLAESPHWIM